MKLTWNKVTWYSKGIALVLFVVLPFAGFWFGFRYGELAGEGNALSVIASSTMLAALPSQSVTSPSAYYSNPSEWQMDNRTGGGFSFAYPIDFQVDDSYSVTPVSGWRLNANGDPGILMVTLTIPSAFEPQTNFADATLTIGRSANDMAVAQCLASDQFGGVAVASSTEMINGIAFTVYHASDAGAGNLYDTTSYRTLHAGQCYAVEYTIHSSQIANYPASYNLQPFDEAAVTNVLQGIVGTFRFE